MDKSKKIASGLMVVLLLIVAALVFLWNQTRVLQEEPFTSTSFAMGTYVQQTVYGESGEQAAQEANSAVQELENRISWRVESSDVARLNAAAGTDWIDIAPETAVILQDALDVAERSNGAFDPTILPISSLWDFGGENQHFPGDTELQRFLPFVDYRNVRVDAEQSKASIKIRGAAIDLGAIGKGAACDQMVRAYQEAGAKAGVAAVGGSIGLYGEKPGGNAWRLAIRAPDSSAEQAVEMGTLDLKEGFVSTSGSYEKTFEEDGRTYHHLLDPKTGYPADNGLVSVTVVYQNGAMSDALSTAAFVLGLEQGRALLEEYGAGGVFIDRDHRVTVTEDLKYAFRMGSDAYTLAE